MTKQFLMTRPIMTSKLLQIGIAAAASVQAYYYVLVKLNYLENVYAFNGPLVDLYGYLRNVSVITRNGNMCSHQWSDQTF